MPVSDDVLSQVEKGDSSSKGTIFGVVIASLIAVMVGGGMGTQFSSLVPSSKTQTVRPKSVANKATKKLDGIYAGDRIVKILLPIVTNLAEPKNAWVRLEGAIILSNHESMNFDALNARISEDTLAYLRTLRMIDLEGASALAYLRDDLTERARIRSKGKILEFVISSLVVE